MSWLFQTLRKGRYSGRRIRVYRRETRWSLDLNGRLRLLRELSLGLSDESTMRFAEQLKARDDGPLKRMLRRELHARVRAALAALNDRDREILVLRHLEQLSSQESAVVLGIREDAAVQRHVRALRRFHRLLAEDIQESN